MPEPYRDAIIVGGGFAGLSAAIYLGRAHRSVTVIDAGDSLGLWEPEVQNYLGFPEGISGEELLARGQRQARAYGAEFVTDTVLRVQRHGADKFEVVGKQGCHLGSRVLLATGLFHIPPDIPRVKECLGHSMFFCKDCDGFRIRGQRIGIFGRNNEAVEYALSMLLYSPCVMILLHGKEPAWDNQHARWVEEYELPVISERIIDVDHEHGKIQSLLLDNQHHVVLDAIFTTRGDIYHNRLAQDLGAETDPEGQVKVDPNMQTSIPGLYAAGCVTPANCQMIIAAGQGATAAQAINRALFEESLCTHSLRRFRSEQLENSETAPEIAPAPHPSAVEK